MVETHIFKKSKMIEIPGKPSFFTKNRQEMSHLDMNQITAEMFRIYQGKRISQTGEKASSIKERCE